MAAGSHSRHRFSLRQFLGELFLTAGAVLLLFVFYEAYWTNVASGKLQQEASAALDERWESSRVNPRGQLHPELGDAFAKMYIPAFGSDFQFAIVEGTSESDLLAGPGRYSDSQLPGEIGNFAVAGHRVGKGAPFNDLDKLATCDAIVIETRSQWITYRVLPIDGQPADCLSPQQQEKLGGQYAAAPGRHITHPGDIGVIFPVPGADFSAPASEALLTLTTCHPQFSNAERMIIHAMATETLDKESGERPSALN